MSADGPHTGIDEHLFRQLVESVRDYAIFVLDPEGRIQTWNAGAQLIKGYTAEEVIGAHFSIFYTPEDLAAGRAQLLLDTAASAGRVEDAGWRVRRDGSRFWAEVTITSRRDDDGRLLGFTKITRDLTVRRMAEEQLRRSEERARLIIDGVTDYAIFMLDPEGRVTTWNAGAERLKGYRADEIIGESLERFYSKEDLEAGKAARELEGAARDGRFEDEGWRIRKDGSRFWANVVLTSLRDPNGHLIGFAKVTRDLTERVQLEEERVRAARAEEALRLRDEFLAVVSHELRTPLSAMLLGLHGVHERLTHDHNPLAVRLERTVRAGQRLSRLIDDLLDVSRIAAGRPVLARETVDLAEVVTQVTDLLRSAAEGAGSDLRVEVIRGCHGDWDRTKLEQVMSNLMSNAMKFGAGHPIEVTMRADAQGYEVRVADRGPGVEEADLQRIFQRFERAASIRNHGGLGLGLYIAERIVDAHGGTLKAARRDGGGAEFVLRLPRETL
ncbi:MAG TPA: PAS domain-containing sensor histidine kinase [Nannocystaceae bacterium]|nr:PAS domain-containing sensor histidine kinase [Nannocystaceae bacterium]